MYNVGFSIKSHQDAAEFIAKYYHPLTTHFYDEGHFTNTAHLATVEEGREYLDLLLELAKTFPSDNPRFARRDEACFATVARLMAIAEIKLSEHDKQHILDYTTNKYDSDYLNYACQIRDAHTMVHYVADFWDQVTMLESYRQRAAALSDKIDALARFKLIKRFRLAYQYAWWLHEIQVKSTLISYDHVTRLRDWMNSIYNSNLNYAYPLIFFHRPTNTANKLFPEQQLEDEIRAEAESHDLYRKFGDEKLARLLDLLPGFSMEYFVFNPDTNIQIKESSERKQQVLAAYPELESYYDKFFTFDLVRAGKNRGLDEELHKIVQNLAEVFGAKEYLSVANYSRSKAQGSEKELVATDILAIC